MTSQHSTLPTHTAEHYTAVLGDGTMITFPRAAWLNQALVRCMVEQLKGEPIPNEPLPQKQWAAMMTAVFDTAEVSPLDESP